MSERISWRKVAWVGLVGALFVGACSVGDDDGIDDEDSGGANSGGSSGKGGTSSSGGKGGTGGTAGSAGKGGTSSTGGTGAGGEGAVNGEGGSGNAGSETTPLCDMVSAGGGDSDPVGTPQDDCEPADTDDDCGKCVKETCCDEWNSCGGYEPYNVCGWGGPDNTGEFNCVLDCLQDVFEAEGLITEDDQFACADECVTTSDVNGMNCGQIGDETSALLGCVLDADNFDCQVSCGLAE